MSTAAEVVRVLRQAGAPMDGRAIYARGSFHDLQTVLQVLQTHSKPDGFLLRDKPGNSATFVYGLKEGAKLPREVEDELQDEAGEAPINGSMRAEPKPPTPALSPPKAPTVDLSGKRLHEHLFRTLEQLENGEIDHVQAKARAHVADQIIKLANVQLLYAQLKLSEQITDMSDMPLIGKAD